MSGKKPEGGVSVIVFVTSLALAVMTGVGLAWRFAPSGPQFDGARNAIAPEAFAQTLTDMFPEAYPQFARITYERLPDGGLRPAEMRFFAPSRAFSADILGDAGLNAAMNDLGAPFKVGEPISRAAITERARGLTKTLNPAAAAQCPSYDVGREQMVRRPDWPDQRVREVYIALNIDC